MCLSTCVCASRLTPLTNNSIWCRDAWHPTELVMIFPTHPPPLSRAHTHTKMCVHTRAQPLITSCCSASITLARAHTHTCGGPIAYRWVCLPTHQKLYTAPLVYRFFEGIICVCVCVCAAAHKHHIFPHTHAQGETNCGYCFHRHTHVVISIYYAAIVLAVSCIGGLGNLYLTDVR